MMGWGPCPSCGEERLGSTTYPTGVTWYADGPGAYLPDVTDFISAEAAMRAGAFRCASCGWEGRLSDQTPGPVGDPRD